MLKNLRTFSYWPKSAKAGQRGAAPMPDAVWLAPAAIFVAAQYAGALIVTQALNYEHRPPLVEMLSVATFLAFVGAIVLTLVFIARMAVSGEEQPIARLRAAARNHWFEWLTYFGAFLLFALQIGSLTWLKSMLPYIVPFWADPMLAEADRWLLGEDAWKLAHRWFSDFNTLIDWTYGSWFTINTVLVVVTLQRPPSFNKARALLAYFLTVGLFGVIGQYALSSAGPIFYERLGLGADFAAMPISPIAERASNYLWVSRMEINAPVGAGISAMPSLHVATSLWIALVCSTMFPRWIGVLAAAFATMIFIGSVYLGWHYLLDSVAGLIAAWISWRLATAYVSRRRGGVIDASAPRDIESHT